MTSQLTDADERLERVVSHFYCVQLLPQDLPVTLQLLPNYEMMLVFNFGPEIPIWLGGETYILQKTAVLGPLQKMITYELIAGADLIVVNFTLDGFYRLLGVSIQDLKAGDLHGPDMLLNKSCFIDLWEQTAHTFDLADRIRLLTEYALAYLPPSDAGAESLLDSIPYFRDSTLDPIKARAQTRQVSARSIQLRFQSHLGYSAEELTRFLRFRKVLTFGYHNYSHLIKDFQYYLGFAPRQFLKQLAQGNVCISKTGRFY